MRYVVARFEQEQRETAYRIYVTDSLMNLSQNKYLPVRYADIIFKNKKEDTRSGDDIAVDIITKLDLKFEN